MLSPSYSNYTMNEQHYLFLSRSLNDLERLVERHRAEQYLIFDQLIEAGFMEPQVEQRQEMQQYHHTARPNSPGFNRRIDQRQEQETQRYRFHLPMSTSFPGPSDSHHHGRSLNAATAELGTRENPIYVPDDDGGQCEVCNEEGHGIVNCTKEYLSDNDTRHCRKDESGRRYFPQ